MTGKNSGGMIGKNSLGMKGKNSLGMKGKNSAGMKGKKMRDAAGAIGKMQNSHERQKRQKVHKMCEDLCDAMTKFFIHKPGLMLVF